MGSIAEKLAHFMNPGLGKKTASVIYLEET